MNQNIYANLAKNCTDMRGLNGSLYGLINTSPIQSQPIAIKEHAADPIKREEDIEAFINYFRDSKKYRDLMYFVLAITTGLRVSDMLRLKFGDLINDDLTWRDEIVILEQKTANTRSRKANRHIAIHDAAKEVIVEYLRNTNEEIDLNTYLFRSLSNNGRKSNKPIHRNNVEAMLKRAASEINLSEKIHISCHTPRKTFGYHLMRQTNNVELVQKIFGHSSASMTLKYIGITAEDIKDAYKNWDYKSPQSDDSLTWRKNYNIIKEQMFR